MKPTFVNSCINKNGLFIFLNKNINTLYWINSKLNNNLLCALSKTEQKATDLIKYKHKIFVDYLKVFRHKSHISDRGQHFQQGSKLAVAHGNQNVTWATWKRRKIAQLALKNSSSLVSLNYRLSVCIVIVFLLPVQVKCL